MSLVAPHLSCSPIITDKIRRRQPQHPATDAPLRVTRCG